MKDKVKIYRGFLIIGILFLLLLIDGFFPFYSLADFGPIVNDEETYISNQYTGWQSAFFNMNLLITGVCSIFGLIKTDKIVGRVILITLSSILLVVLFLHHIANSNGDPFVPEFKIGYNTMLVIDILLISYCIISVENQEEHERLKSDHS